MSWRWWEQEGIDLETAKERAAESTTTDSYSEAESEEGRGGGWGECIKWGKRIKWRRMERSGVKTPGGRRDRPAER